MIDENATGSIHIPMYGIGKFTSLCDIRNGFLMYACVLSQVMTITYLFIALKSYEVDLRVDSKYFVTKSRVVPQPSGSFIQSTPS